MLMVMTLTMAWMELVLMAVNEYPRMMAQRVNTAARVERACVQA